MKALIILSITIAAISFVSCKKDHVCTCTNSSTAAGSTPTTNEITYVDARKVDAKRACVKTTNTNSNGVTTTKDCKLN